MPTDGGDVGKAGLHNVATSGTQIQQMSSDVKKADDPAATGKKQQLNVASTAQLDDEGGEPEGMTMTEKQEEQSHTRDYQGGCPQIVALSKTGTEVDGINDGNFTQEFAKTKGNLI